MNAPLGETETPSYRSFPILGWFFGYQKEWLRWDLVAGLITAAS
jgi:MFS superfamily sulfate permease-like transporter